MTVQMDIEETDHRLGDKKFGEADVIVFACILSFCALLGIARGCMETRERRKKGVASHNLAMGGRSRWTLWTAAQSFLHGAVALPFLLGIPGEVYCFGVIFMIIIIGFIIGAPFFIHVVLVRLHKLRIKNIYEVCIDNVASSAISSDLFL
jgi:Na+/proline symporter